MAKNIKITEGEGIRNMTGVKKLYTTLTEGGLQSWIPEDEAPAYGDYVGLYTAQEGIFTAPLDGFNQVVVDVQKPLYIIGIEDGEEVRYYRDADGNLVKDEVVDDE